MVFRKPGVRPREYVPLSSLPFDHGFGMNAFDSSTKQIDVEHYFRLISRHKWFVIAPAILGLITMGVVSLFMKDIFSAKATVLVEQASLPTDFVKSTLPGGPETYVRSLVEQIKSTSRLEQVIKDFNLYPERRKRQSIEEVVGFMREQISIESRANDTFSVAFSGEDPETVQKVTNRLTDMFIEENVKFRLARSAQNVALMEREAQKLRTQVQEQERRIQEFKSRNLASLPEQGTSNQVQLSATQARLQSLSDGLSSATARLSSARDRIAILQADAGIESDDGNASRPQQDSFEVRLETARQELASLRNTLSEKHPDVRLKQKEVESLEAQLAGRPASPSSRPKRRPRSPELLRAMDDERISQADIARYQSEITRLQEQMTQMQSRIEQTPKVELELNSLSSGLKVLQEQADGYQKKATDAAASLELERQNQGSQFRALDRARVPSRPDSPNRPLLILLGGGMGMALGLLMIIGLDILFRPFLDEQDLARFSGVPVLVSIPHLGPFPSDWQRFKRQLNNLLNFLLGTAPLAGSNYAPSSLRAPNPGAEAGGRAPTQSTRLAPKPRGFTYLAGDALEAEEGTPATVAVKGIGGGGAPPQPENRPVYTGVTTPWNDRAHRSQKQSPYPAASNQSLETAAQRAESGGFARPMATPVAQSGAGADHAAMFGGGGGAGESTIERVTRAAMPPVGAVSPAKSDGGQSYAAQRLNGSMAGRAAGGANPQGSEHSARPQAGAMGPADSVEGASPARGQGPSPRGAVTGEELRTHFVADPSHAGSEHAHTPASAVPSGLGASGGIFKPSPHGTSVSEGGMRGAGHLPSTAKAAFQQGLEAMVRPVTESSEHSEANRHARTAAPLERLPADWGSTIEKALAENRAALQGKADPSDLPERAEAPERTESSDRPGARTPPRREPPATAARSAETVAPKARVTTDKAAVDSNGAARAELSLVNGAGPQPPRRSLVPTIELPKLSATPVQLILPVRKTRLTAGQLNLSNAPWGKSAATRIKPEPLFGALPLLDESLKELGHQAPWLNGEQDAST